MIRLIEKLQLRRYVSDKTAVELQADVEENVEVSDPPEQPFKLFPGMYLVVVPDGFVANLEYQ